VVQAAGDTWSPQHQQALGTLCQTYWYPLYAYVRRQGYDTHQAEDYTQAFFTRMLEKHGLGVADPKRGKFRSFLLSALKHFLANELDRAHAKKRGGDRKILSLDIGDAERRYEVEATPQVSAEKLFDRSWALTVLQRAMDRLQSEQQERDKQELFEQLKVYLTAEKGSVPHAEMAEKLNMTPTAVRVAVHRLRKRYRELLREEISQTVVDKHQVNEEIRDLFKALAR
jgi:RNA polymerase sigma-70 factor (ECF subfamily)